MSDHTRSDICTNIMRLRPNEIPDLRATEDEYDEDGEKGGQKLATGWVFGKIVNAGAKKRLHGIKLEKDGKMVLLINTSQYASVGEVDYAVFGPKLEDVQAFCKDHGIKRKIELMDSLEMTI